MQAFPAELLERIVTAAVFRGSPVLDVADRVRCLAVCKQWREALSFHCIPLPSLDLCPQQGVTDPMTEWVCRNQPGVQALNFEVDDELAFQTPSLQAAYRALLSLHPREVLEELTLGGMASSVLKPLWPAISLFPCLRCLEVKPADESGTVDGSWLSSLPPSLEVLDLGSLDKVIIASDAELLPSLTYLAVGYSGKLAIDAVLPSLRQLATDSMAVTELAGERLQLPQLTQLQLCLWSARVCDFDLHCMPSLQRIDFGGCPPAAAPGLSGLLHLTSLDLCLSEPDNVGPALELLQQVPAQLCRLGLNFLCDLREASDPLQADAASQVAPALRRLTQLTSLSIGSPALLPYLAALPHLRCLELLRLSAGQLSIQDADFLAGIRGLQQLTFGGSMSVGEERTRRLQLLAYILPAGCVIHQPGKPQ